MPMGSLRRAGGSAAARFRSAHVIGSAPGEVPRDYRPVLQDTSVPHGAAGDTEPRPGGLVFFSAVAPEPSHVGLALAPPPVNR